MLDVFAGESEQIFCLEKEVLVDYFSGGAPGAFLDYERQIFWRNTKAVSIEAHGVLGAEIFADEPDEFMGIEHAAGAGPGAGGLVIGGGDDRLPRSGGCQHQLIEGGG